MLWAEIDYTPKPYTKIKIKQQFFHKKILSCIYTFVLNNYNFVNYVHTDDRIFFSSRLSFTTLVIR